LASAFFAGFCRPEAAICFFRASSITVIAVSHAPCAFSIRAAAASFSRAAGAAASCQAAISPS
jgi:hypothetical protein